WPKGSLSLAGDCFQGVPLWALVPPGLRKAQILGTKIEMKVLNLKIAYSLQLGCKLVRRTRGRAHFAVGVDYIDTA
ncbi:MAG: hypothetical protein KDD22_03740, partial [Bdellovibrionales bacterium]|nr:hypothetical protein [Bdellovibrionales bacterium]